MVEQEPSILGQLVNNQPTVPPSGQSEQDRKWLEEIDRVYNASILPINPKVNSDVIGNLPAGPPDPLDQQTNSTEKYARGIVDMINTSNQWANDPNSYSQPFSYGAGWRSGNFERYYSSPSFKKLGYFPGRDNEAVYNENTGFIGDFARMVPKMASLTVDAAMDMASEWGSWGLNDPDVSMAEDFQRTMATGMSTRGGVGGFVTNLSLNLAYPIGIMAEMFVEDLALAGITALTGGTASPTTGGIMAARTGKAAKKIYESLTSLNKLQENLKSSYDAVRSIKNINSAREFMKAAKLDKVADFVNPFEQTTKLIRNYDKLKGLGGWAKAARGAEALYRDARFINAVTGEAKLEAGFRKIEQTNELINDYYNTHNELPTGEALEKINQNASDAAFYVGLTNMPMIFLTDKIVFDTAIKGSKYLKSPEVVGEELLSRTGEKLIVEDGVAKVIKRGSVENLKTIFTPKALASRSMRYLGKNFAQGLQETTQDIIQETFKDYYSRVYKDPTVASMAASLGTGLSSQLTAQGFETFLSGFFMGGAMGVVQNTLYNGIMGIGYRTVAPERYGKWKEGVDNYVNTFVNFYNDAKKDPNKFSSALRGLESALVRSKDMANFAEAAGLDSDSVKEVIDAKDEQAFHALIDFIEAGHGKHLNTLIDDFKGMSNEELAAAFGVDPESDHANSDAKKRLDVFEKRINLANKLWKDSLRDMPNPIDLKKAQQEGNFIAQGAYRDFENYRRLAVFHFYSLQRALDRQESVYNAIINDSKLGNIPSSEVSPLLSTVGLGNQIQTLKAEVKALKDIDPVEYKKKQAELEILEDYQKLLTEHVELYATNAQLSLIKAEKEHGEKLADIQQASQEAVNTSKNKLKKAYKDIIKRLAGKYNVPLLDRDVNNSFSLVHDHYLLNIDVRNVANIADVLTNPENMRDLINRWLPEVRKAVEAEELELLKQGLEKFFGKQALDTLTKRLSGIGIVIPDDELAKLMAKPAMPISYVVDIVTNKRIPITEGKGLEAKAIIDTWLNEVNAPEKEVKPKEAAKPSKAASEPGVGPDKGSTLAVKVEDRVSPDLPLAKYPSNLSDLKAKLQAAFEAENKRRKEDQEPQISEITFLEGPIAMGIVESYYEAKEKTLPKKTPAVPVATQPASVAPTTPAPVTQAPTAPVSVVDIKKADAQTVKNRMQEIEKTPVTINITQDAEGKIEQTSEEVISSIKSELDKIGLPYSDVVANDKGSTYFVVTKDGQQHEILKLVKTGNALVKPILAKAKWINHLIKTQLQDLYDFVNAKQTTLEGAKPIASVSGIDAKKADIEIGKVGNTEYEVKSDGVYYKDKKLDNPENKTHRQLIEADIERRRQEEITVSGLAADLRGVISSRLIKEGVPQEERNKLIGTRTNPIISSAKRDDINNLIQSYKDNRQKQLNEFNSKGEGFNPESGNFVNNDTSFWDNKISKLEEINAKYDAEYVDAVKKGEMTKEQAMQALEQAGRKGSDAYTELAALEGAKPTEAPKKKVLAISKPFQGKIIYASPGAGKTTLFEQYDNIIDVDQLLAEGMKKAGLTIEPNETIGQAVSRNFKIAYDKMEKVYQEVSMDMQNFADLGFTVLTGSNRFISIADHVIITENDERLKQNLSGGMTVEEFRTKEMERIQEPGKPGRSVTYMTIEETLEGILTEKTTEETSFDPIALINQSKDLSELKANWQQIIDFYINSNTLIPNEIDIVYQSKLRDLTKDITYQTVEVGMKLKVKNNVRSVGNTNFIEFFAGNVIEVVSKNKKGVYVVKVDSLPSSQKKIPVYLTNSRFDAMKASVYDSAVPDEVIPTPSPENEKIARENNVIQDDEAKKNADIIAERRKKRKQDPGSKPDDAKPC